MARKYFVLLERDDAAANWGVNFGDYDADAVAEEREDILNGGVVKASNLKLLTVANDSQSAIDSAVAKLNANWRNA